MNAEQHFNTDPDDRHLLEQAKQLNADAFGKIFDAYYDTLYGYIYRRIRHIETAQDLTSDVFAQLLKAVNEGKGPDTYLRAWLYRVARNIIIDETRRQKYRNHNPLDETQPSEAQGVDVQAQSLIMQAQAREALETLSTRQRDVLTLRYLEGLSTSETAHVMQTSERNVRALHKRGLEALRDQLDGSGAGE